MTRSLIQLIRFRVMSCARHGAWLQMNALAYFLLVPPHHVMHAWRLILLGARPCLVIRWCWSCIQVPQAPRGLSGLHPPLVVLGALHSMRALMIQNCWQAPLMWPLPLIYELVAAVQANPVDQRESQLSRLPSRVASRP